ncbi:MAG: DEAD/DEAH box helicase family protein [SAR324 cluster bacterium]|nr:DEAD/DEAH box helicase family protein [SAR324 cluster bacterium]
MNLPTLIKQYMSLREPQEKALETLDSISTGLDYKTTGIEIVEEKASTNSKATEQIKFDTEFPSFCFALATGVGQTRLMGASIYYLWKTKGYKNFFILSPNITIYEKLRMELFASHPKYMFIGLSDFSQPSVWDGDNYLRFNPGQFTLYGEANIFIFNIGKIFSRGDTDFRFHRFHEQLGDSFSAVLRDMDDLVVLMDESHRYRAPASLKAINHLKPILGLEFTATPKTKDNVIYSFTLAESIGRFIKTPTVVTRSNLTTSDAEEIEKLKLLDGMTLHEIKKGRLLEYCAANHLPVVKPFVLISTKDTHHAGEIKQLVESESFFEGCYKGKVIEIHSAQGSAESDENIKRLLSVESPNSNVEIVIHVNMLKEGWDVKNLYTIIPLRASISEILTEQTIGRGLRLPFGTITDDADLDSLEIISHDNYAKLIDAAKNSPLFRVKELSETDTKPRKTVTVQRKYIDTEELLDRMHELDLSLFASQYTQKEKITEVVERLVELDIKEYELKKEKTETGGGDKKSTDSAIGATFFDAEDRAELPPIKPEEIRRKYEEILINYAKLTIDVPKIFLDTYPKSDISTFDVTVNIGPFELVTQKIIEHDLASGVERQRTEVELMAVDDPVKFIAGRLIDEIDELAAENDKDIALNLARLYLEKMNVNERDLKKVVHLYRKAIVNDLQNQIEANIHEENEIEVSISKNPVRFPKEYSKTVYLEKGILHYGDRIEPSQIKSYLFEGFEKTIYPQIPFDSVPEKDFAAILEKDSTILKWVRPPEGSIPIYHRGHSYTPDFVVETVDKKYLIEVKGMRDLQPVIKEDVKEKARVSIKWAETATNEIKDKPWEYKLIPETAIVNTSDLKFIFSQGVHF